MDVYYTNNQLFSSRLREKKVNICKILITLINFKQQLGRPSTPVGPRSIAESEVRYLWLSRYKSLALKNVVYQNHLHLKIAGHDSYYLAGDSCVKNSGVVLYLLLSVPKM